MGAGDDIRPALEEALARAGELEPRWSDVLARAGVVAPRRRPTRRLLLAAVALAVLVPAIALAGLRVAGRGSGGLELRATVQLPGNAGSARFVTAPQRAFSHVGSRGVVGFTPRFSWSLSITGRETEVNALLVLPGRSVPLCQDCGRSSHGVFPVRGFGDALIEGRVSIELSSGGRISRARVTRR